MGKSREMETNTLSNASELDKLPVPQAVARRIQDMIRDGIYAVDQRLPSQRDLAETLGASRASVREALLSLETLGLVRTLPARGTFVTDPHANPARGLAAGTDAEGFDLSDVFKTRTLIESELAAEAASVISDAEIAQLRQHQQAFRNLWEEGDLVGHVNADLRFHQALAAACPNVLLRQIYDGYSRVLTASQRLPIPVTDDPRMMQSIAEHDAILAALTARDPEQARAAMAAHINATAQSAVS